MDRSFCSIFSLFISSFDHRLDHLSINEPHFPFLNKKYTPTPSGPSSPTHKYAKRNSRSKKKINYANLSISHSLSYALIPSFVPNSIPPRPLYSSPFERKYFLSLSHLWYPHVVWVGGGGRGIMNLSLPLASRSLSLIMR